MLRFYSTVTTKAKYFKWIRKLSPAWNHALPCSQSAGFKYLIVPVGEGRGLIRWAMLSGMFIVKGEIWGCTGFTGDSGASCFSLLSLDRAVNVILMFVLGNLKVQLKNKKQIHEPLVYRAWAFLPNWHIYHLIFFKSERVGNLIKGPATTFVLQVTKKHQYGHKKIPK